MSALLLTGAPGVGKTTVIRKLAASLPEWRFAGFRTDEIRVAGDRTGFRILTFDGRERIMAHVNFPGPARVGKYGVDVPAIDELAATALALESAVDAYLVDEIGKMECMSAIFVGVIRKLFASSKPVVATVALKGGGFIAEVKCTGGAQLWHVTRENRDALPAQVVNWLKGRRAEPPVEGTFET